MGDSAKQRIEKLREQLHHHNHLYYMQDRPQISDREYDKLMQELIDLERQHPDLITPDSPTQRVGGDVQDELKPVQHAVPMMSIDNTYSEAEVRAFDERVRKGLDGDKPSYVLEPKIDGTSISLRYEGGKLVLGATRGRGNMGEDITANARTIKSVPLVLRRDAASEPIPPILEVRGEVYIDNDDFQLLNKELAAEGKEPYKNPRNLSAGTLRRLDPKEVSKGRLRFLAHGNGQVEPMPATSYLKWTQLLREWGFPLPREVWHVQNVDEAIKCIHEFEKIRPKLPYMTDGMVMKVDAFAHRDVLGATSKAPRWVIAYKYETEQQPTVLQAVRWQVGRSGKLTPVADVEPVFIGGVTVTHATLHNIDQIRRLDLHMGDTIVIERSGEVIPYVVEVVKEKRNKGSRKIDPPDKCPECGTKTISEELPEEIAAYRCINTECDDFFTRKRVKRAKLPEKCPVCGKKVEILDSGIDIFCPNPKCPAQLKERIRWFCHKSQMDIEGIGDKLVDQLVDTELVKDFADLYKLKESDIATLSSESTREGETIKRVVGEKTAKKVIDNIAESRQRPLDRVLAGLGIDHVGNRVAHVLASNFGSLDVISAATQEQLAAVHEIGDVIAESVYNYFHDDTGQREIKLLKDAGIDPKMAKPAASEQVLAGKTIVVTGTLHKFDRQGIEDLITKLGGKASGSVSKKTSFLVAGEDAGSKLDKARELGVKVLTEDEFLKEIGKA